MRLLLSLLVTTIVMTTPLHAATPPPQDDPGLWLEDVTGEKPLEWVKGLNERSTAELSSTPDFTAMQERFLAILDSRERIPGVSRIGERYYNFWRDAQHPRGLWRRTTLAEYRKPQPAWETVLDLDALAASEKENWVWGGARVLSPSNDRCLVSLSRGGADAKVVREFDLVTRSFVVGGFELPESKSDVGWIDRDRLHVGMAFDSTTMTTSGYPRQVREWRRGTPLSAATLLFEGALEDVAVGAYHDPTPGFERDFLTRGMTFYTNELWFQRGEQRIKIDKPDDAEANVWREWMFVQLRTAWTTGGRTWPAGSLIVTRFEDFLAGQRAFTALFTPTPRTSLAGYTTTRGAVVLNVLDQVRSRLAVARPGSAGWKVEPVQGLPAFGTISAWAVDDLESDDYWISVTDFLTPTSLYLGNTGSDQRELLKQDPVFFDASGLEVGQFEAVSKDGTRIPYFQVSRKGLKLDGSAITLLTGYGGFEVSEQPYYSGVQGSGWLERGGVLVVANIRGGGEFGPEWHQSAIKQNRQRCYEDFSAVARDLIARRVTSPAHLGCMGGSNGGLLVGNMLVQYPELFGAIVCQVPLLDMKRYSHLLAGASWMGEYGDPDRPEEWEFIRGFSPYHLVTKDAKYPRTLFTTSTRDDRVHPGHARKMVARMMEQGHDVLYYENIEGGHGGAANSRQRAFMSALGLTFLWRQLGGVRP
jgi:prolyl oligopeptidase